MAVKRWSNLRPQYVDTVAVGNPPLNGGRLFFYAAGTSTKQNTYTDSTGATPNANPIVLSSAGEPSVEIWLTVGQTYKVGLAIAGVDDPPASFLWTEDAVSPINDGSGFATTSEWIPFSSAVPTFISATSFSILGSFVTTFEVNRRIKTTNTGGTIYSTISAVSFDGTRTTVTVVNDSGVIDSGLSAVSYGILSISNPSDPFVLNVQTFMANGTWTKPANSKIVEVLVIGAGGGGAGGRGGAAASVRQGGSGGGGGAIARGLFRASDLSATETITIGTGGTSGAGGSSADGVNGGIGGNSSFGARLFSYGGGGGNGGSSATDRSGGSGGGTGSAGTTGSTLATMGGSPASAAGVSGSGGSGSGGPVASAGPGAEYGGAAGGGTRTDATLPGSGGGSIYGAGGGGGGGGVTSANAEGVGFPGGSSGTFINGGGGAGGAVTGGVGANGADGTAIILGAGGGGGGGRAAGTGGAGGNGGAPGGAGGGGAGGTTIGGAGGVGARGEVRVYSYS